MCYLRIFCYKSVDAWEINEPENFIIMMYSCISLHCTLIDIRDLSGILQVSMVHFRSERIYTVIYLLIVSCVITHFFPDSYLSLQSAEQRFLDH